MGLLIFEFGPHYESYIAFAVMCDDDVESEVVESIAKSRETIARFQNARDRIASDIRENPEHRRIVEEWEESHSRPIKPKGPSNGTGAEYKAYEPIRRQWEKEHDEWERGRKEVLAQWQAVVDALTDERVKAELIEPQSLEEMLKERFGERAAMIPYRKVAGNMMSDLKLAVKSETRPEGRLLSVGYTYGFDEW